MKNSQRDTGKRLCETLNRAHEKHTGAGMSTVKAIVSLEAHRWKQSHYLGCYSSLAKLSLGVLAPLAPLVLLAPSLPMWRFMSPPLLLCLDHC